MITYSFQNIVKTIARCSLEVNPRFQRKSHHTETAKQQREIQHLDQGHATPEKAGHFTAAKAPLTDWN